MWWLTKCVYSIHLFHSVHICVLCFCEALAGEVTIVLLVLSCRTVKSWSVSCVSKTFTHGWTNWCLRFWFCGFCPCLCSCPCSGFDLNGFFAGWICESLCQPFFFCTLAFGLPCFQTWLTTSALGFLPVALVPLMYFAFALPASSFLSFCQIVAAVTSGDSSLMIFEMKSWSFRPNRKMSHCRTDSISGLKLHMVSLFCTVVYQLSQGVVPWHNCLNSSYQAHSLFECSLQ